MKISIDEAAWTARGLTFMKQGNLYRFLLPGLPGSADARVVDGELDLVPGQATTHRALCKALGVAADA